MADGLLFFTRRRENPHLWLPPGGKLSPQVTDEGATRYPTEWEKKYRCSIEKIAHRWFSCHVGYGITPSSDPASPAHLPPEGKAIGVA